MLRIWKNFCKEFRQLCVGGSAHSETVHINSGSISLSSDQDVNHSCIEAYQQTAKITSSVKHGQTIENEQKSAHSSSHYKWNLSKSIFLEICGLSSAVALGWELSPLRRKRSHLCHGFPSGLANTLTKLALSNFCSGVRLTINDVASGALSNVSWNTAATQASSNYLETTTTFTLSLTEEINDTLENIVTNLESSSDLDLAEWQNSVGVELTKSAREKKLSEYDHLINHLESDRCLAYQREALNCFAESRKLGSTKGCYNLGICYEQGLGTSIDQDKAVVYYEEAACKNHPAAQYNLGLLLYRRYLSDETSKENDARAVNLLRQAARQGLREASSALMAISGETEQDVTSYSTTSRILFANDRICNEMVSLRKALSEPRSFTYCQRYVRDTADRNEVEITKDSISFYIGN